MQVTAEKYKTQVLSNAYWTAAQQAVLLLTPAVKLLRLADGDTPTTGKLHWYAHKVRAARALGLSAAVECTCLQAGCILHVACTLGYHQGCLRASQ